MATVVREVIAGVDTHADTHHAAVIDTNGKRLGDKQFPATQAGYAALQAFLASFGTVIRAGIEGTGSYGAGLARHLRDAGLEVVEVVRPNRQVRRMRGKSDPINAHVAATTTLSESQLPVPKSAEVRSRRSAICSSPAAVR